MILIRKRISDKSVLKLIRHTLKVGIKIKGEIVPTRRGVLQGSPISPLYSNIYLNLIDQLWSSRGYDQKLKSTLHCYADDCILICQSWPKPALAAFKAIAKRMDLTVNHDKTRIRKLTKGFEFIGYHFVMRKSRKTGRYTLYVEPTKASQQRIRNRLKYLTPRKTPISPKEFVDLVNPVVRGWVNYYLYTNASDAFRRLQRFTNTRFRRYLTYKSKGKGFGWRKYPNSKLYEMGIIYIASGLLEYTKRPV